MTREIRAWDKIDQKMRYDIELILSRNSIINQSFCVDFCGIDDANETDLKDVELMENTGFLDKKGKKIFTGDLVKGIFRIQTGEEKLRRNVKIGIYKEMEVVGHIIFNKEKGSYFFDTNFKYYYFHSFWKGVGRTKFEKEKNAWSETYDTPKNYLSAVRHKIEVIGNIYEYNHLLD